MKFDGNSFMKTTVLIIAALGMLTPDVKACGKNPGEAGPFSLKLLAPLLQSQSRPPASILGSSSSENENEKHDAKIVGLWTVNFYVGTTTELWDYGLEVFYADGNEMTNDDFTPPAGGLCWGVWEPSGRRTVKLNHIGLGFESGHFLGMFRLTADLTLDRDGDAFRGTYVADQYDLSGNPIASYHGEGNLSAQRIKIDTVKTTPF